MAVYTFFFQENLNIAEIGGGTVTSNTPGTVPTPIPLPDIQDDTLPLIVDGPEDHDFPPDGAPSAYIAICMAVKNQGPNLTEYFVHHYHHLGIGQFYIMDDGFDPPFRHSTTQVLRNQH